MGTVSCNQLSFKDGVWNKVETPAAPQVRPSTFAVPHHSHEYYFPLFSHQAQAICISTWDISRNSACVGLRFSFW